MSSPLQAVCWSNLLLSLGLFLHCGEARVHTEAQAGPLYRVVDSRLSISCNVSGFASNSARKEFEFRVKKPALPIEINIISTDDPSFSYAVYARRVRSKEITLTHVSPNSVVFEIQRLEKSDEGEYECFVINSESVYDGVYRAKTTVKVLDNSLTVSSPGSTSLSYNEGETLTLTCQASSNTVQHTHLSLAWYVHKNGEDGARPIISLDRDFTLSPGQGFAGRHQAGLIRLDKIGAATYNLKMAKLGLSDQGRIYCQAQEWVQDPDRSWYCIAQTDADGIALNVKAKEVAPTTLSLVVNILAQPTTLQEGQELLLSCSIQSQALEESFFSVAWLRGGVELARIGPTGILSVGPEYSARVKEGELRAARTAAGDYSLILQPVRTEDQGEYICRAWPQDRGQDGGFTEGAAHDSSSKRVSISPTESGLSLQMQNNVSVNESDTLKLTCKVHGAQGQLSVTWQHKAAATPTAAFASVISLNQEGVMEKAAELKSRKVKATRAAADTFILELDEVTPSDSGVYQCAVSEWKINSKISQSRTANVTVAPTESFVNVKLISRNNIVSVGETVELICRIRGLNVPATLTWSLQRDASTLDNILTQYSDGSISWSGEQHRYQLKVEVKEYQALHYLIINGVSHREAGRYQCGVSVFLDNVHKKLPPSNPLAVNVQNPVSKLLLTSTSARTSNINTDIEITCSVALSSSASSCYAVTWLLRQPGENKTIISSDRDALLTYGSQLELSYKQRIGMKRTVGPTFVLGIRQAQISDKGSYICEVVEWLQDPQRDWYQLSSASRTIELTLIEPANSLRLDQRAQSLVATEGDEVEFRCNIISDASSPSLFYKVSWLYAEYGSSIANALVELDHTGLLRYPENQGLRGLQERLRLSRPTQSSFYLGIHRAHEGDSGMYKCKIEQYQLDHKAHWQQKASESAAPVSLTVNVPGKNLSLAREEVEQNVSTSRDFTIPCHITQQSSGDSEFQVTWFWRQDTETEQRPIFTAYRNSTLQTFGKGDRLRFSHPLPNQFNLTVSNSGPDDSGLYSCEVEEWLPSLSRGWMKTTVEKSGYSTVNIYPQGEPKDISEPECDSVKWVAILVTIVIVTLFVIFVLLLKICQNKGEKKAEQSLWTEQHPLQAKPSGDD